MSLICCSFYDQQNMKFIENEQDLGAYLSVRFSGTICIPFYKTASPILLASMLNRI